MAGPLGLRDAWIPVLCLSLGQFETVLTTPNASHSVLPLALILLAANVWLSPRPVVRYLGAGTAAVVLIFTGFGLFAGGVLAFLLGARIVRHALAREYREMWLATAGFMAVGVGWVGFARGYTFMPAVEGFRFPWTPWTDYLRPGMSGPARRITGWASSSRWSWRLLLRASRGSGDDARRR
jgi:hypothetical protein